MHETTAVSQYILVLSYKRLEEENETLRILKNIQAGFYSKNNQRKGFPRIPI